MKAHFLSLAAMCAVLIPSLASAVGPDHEGRGCTERGGRSRWAEAENMPNWPVNDDWCPTVPRRPKWPGWPPPTRPWPPCLLNIES